MKEIILDELKQLILSELDNISNYNLEDTLMFYGQKYKFLWTI